MHRRQFLFVGATTTVAGCVGDNGSDDSDAADATGDDADDEQEDQDDYTDPEDYDWEQQTYDGNDGFPIELAGTGPAVFHDVPLDEAVRIFEATHEGDGEFVFGYGLSDRDASVEWNVIDGSAPISGDGPLESERLVHLNRNYTGIVITTHGTWEIAVRRLPTEDPEPLPVEIDGEGYTIAGPFEFTGETSLEATFEEDTTFHAHVWSEDRRLPDSYLGVTQRHSLDGVTFSHEGLGWLSVDAESEFSVTIEDA